jgi:hypothetical protein
MSGSSLPPLGVSWAHACAAHVCVCVCLTRACRQVLADQPGHGHVGAVREPVRHSASRRLHTRAGGMQAMLGITCHHIHHLYHVCHRQLSRRRALSVGPVPTGVTRRACEAGLLPVPSLLRASVRALVFAYPILLELKPEELHR